MGFTRIHSSSENVFFSKSQNVVKKVESFWEGTVNGAQSVETTAEAKLSSTMWTVRIWRKRQKKNTVVLCNFDFDWNFLAQLWVDFFILSVFVKEVTRSWKFEHHFFCFPTMARIKCQRFRYESWTSLTSSFQRCFGRQVSSMYAKSRLGPQVQGLVDHLHGLTLSDEFFVDPGSHK